MPENDESKKRKARLRDLLCDRLGDYAHPRPRRPDWYSFTGGTVDVFITDADMGLGWYDVQQADVEELASQTKSFFIFLLGHENHYLVIPAKDLSAQLLYHRGPTGRGFFHLNFSENHEGMRFKETPEWELFPYLNEIERVEGVASPAVA